LKILGTLEDDSPIQLGQKLTEEVFTDMQKGVQEIRYKYPVNYWLSGSAKELSHFVNAAIYEGLEDGKL
jgi:hypothetical protein